MKQTNLASQRGIGFTKLITLGLALGFGGIAAFKVGKPYADIKIVQKLTKTVLAEAKLEPTTIGSDIVRKILERANIQSITLSADDIHVSTTNPAEFSVRIDLITKIKLWENASFVLELSTEDASK